MPKRKVREPERFGETFEPLFTVEKQNFALHADRLRTDLHFTVDKALKLVTYLRNLIPDSANSDARNCIQALTDRIVAHFSSVINDYTIVANRYIRDYRRIRKDKRQEREKKRQRTQ